MTSFRPYQDDAGLWRWRLLAANGRIIADSGQGYSRRASCLRAIRRLLNDVKNARVK